MDVSSLLDNLNDPQREAVCAEPVNQLILAGAGSGKTRVLIHRIAWLTRVLDVSPHQILAVTFTNKAAKEMRTRLLDLQDDPLYHSRVNTMWVGTFHGIAHRLLKSHWQEANLPKNFQILDSDDQLRMVKRVYQALNIDDKRWPHKQSQWFINGQKDEGLRPHHISDSADPYTQTMKTIYAAYEESCARSGVVDFAELLLRSHELWLNNPSLLAHYQQRFKHILVDEFQDTNAVQYAWLRVLAGQTGKVTAVGDDDQSIYGWRGARIENIQTFEQDFANTMMTRLEQNYRSTSTILSASNNVIGNNSGRLGKSLWTESGDGDPIDLYSAFNEQDEARFIVERVEDWVSKGNSKDGVAILYRSNAQSRVLEEAFLREGIAYRIYGGQRFYDRLEIKNALAYLRLILNRLDDAAFERVINTPTRGIGNKTVETIRTTARDQGCSMFEAVNALLKNKVLPARAATALDGFLQLINQLDEGVRDIPLADQAERVIEQSGLYEFHGKEKGERGQARLENLAELVNACKSFAVEESDATPLEAFLDTAALDAGDRQADEYEEAVQMMTLHSAKGLEFPLVFMVGMEEKLFPHKMSMDGATQLEEERRLCYVGMTRAMQKLVLTYAESRRLHGAENFNPVSRFIREIPNDLVQEVRVKSTITRPSSYGQSGSFGGSSLVESNIGDIWLGQQVTHKKFGDGVVLQFEGQGASARVQVQFDDAGSKWLVMQYAKLEPMD